MPLLPPGAAAFAVGASEHPMASHAAAEAVGQVLERSGPAPDVALLFATGTHIDALDELARAVRSLLRPGTLIGATTSSVVAGRREIEHGPALVVWSARLDGVRPVRLGVGPGPGGGVRVSGLDATELAEAHSLVLMADPASLPLDGLLAHLARVHPHLSVVGGASSSGTARFVIDDTVCDQGGVGLLLDGSTRVDGLVGPGCRPIGDPFTVTGVEGHTVLEMGSRPAIERLVEAVEGLAPDERLLVGRGLHVGVVADEHRLERARGDFVIRNLMGLDRTAGGVVISQPVELGATLQFQIRDARAADEDLRAAVAETSGRSALVFCGTGRGTHLFDEPDHDAKVVSDQLDDAPVAGMFCAGEIAPVAGRPRLQSLSAAVAVFTDAAPPVSDLEADIEADPQTGSRGR